ncbi:MAG: mandelate racemase/muconate lactonizing enzyme family protein [Lautropia sp.]
MLRPTRIRTHLFRYPIASPVVTSFGRMTDRPALFVEVEDADGARGWGEIWCNFPACGAEHRARLLDTVVAPIVTGRAFATPADAFTMMTAGTAVLAIQSGEPGPIAQTIAGVDTAFADLAARRAGLPLWRWLRETGQAAVEPPSGEAAPSGPSPALVPYASGINPDSAGETAARCLAEGFRAFKLKTGFGRERDLANLADIRAAIGAALPLMIDANQAWDIDTAMAIAPALAPFGLGWLEEPLRADRPWDEWRRLAGICPVPLAAGENIAGDDAFARALAAGVLRVLQPDLAKWGGISGNVPVIRRALAAGLRYCPHFLGGGIGLMASAHLAAAFGGGLVEVDSNENPLRAVLATPLLEMTDGRVRLGAAPGIGIEPDWTALGDWRVG